MNDSVTINCSLSTFSKELDCYVLNPKAFKVVINAFHPDYIKTYHPELLTAIRIEGAQKANGSAGGGKTKASREAVNKGAFTISKFPKTKAKDRAALAPRDFHVFNKAGMPTGVKK